MGIGGSFSLTGMSDYSDTGLHKLMEGNSVEITGCTETKQIVLREAIWVENSWRLGDNLGD